MIRVLYRLINRNWWQITSALLGVILLLLLLLAMGGCTRSESQARTVEIEKTTGTENGKPVDLTTIRRTQTETQTTAGIDPQAIASAVSTAVSAAIPGADSIGRAVAAAFPKPEPANDWPTLAGTVGATLTAATTGYLALKKREQMKAPRGRA
jgi:hypothetical protein